MYYAVKAKLSHAEWRKLVKKEQRRHQRKKLAKLRDEALLAATQNSYYQSQLLAEQSALQLQEEVEQLRHQQRKAEWQARDLAIHALFVHNKNVKEQRERKEREQQELIKKEWECKKKQDENTKKSDEKSLKSCEVSSCAPQSQLLLQQAQGALAQPLLVLTEQGGGESSTNPEPPSTLQAPPAHQVCPFFTKTGACRFGNRCSRPHVYPAVSRTLLLPNMYAAPGALPGADSDAALEHDDKDRRDHFREFFQDFCSEASKHGGLLEVRVCCNTVHHLRGNVYLRYERTGDAVAAAAALHGRYYAGRVVTCLFVPVENFRAAICGVYWRNLCPKGGGCNFLHPHPNPSNAYTGAPQHGAPGRHRSEVSSRSSQRSTGSSSRRSRSRSPRSSRSYKRSKSPASSRSSTRTGSPSSERYSVRRPDSDRSHRSRRQNSSRSSRNSRSKSKSPRPFKRKHSKSKRDEKRISSPTARSGKPTLTASPGNGPSPSKTRRKRQGSRSPSRKQSAAVQPPSFNKPNLASAVSSTNNQSCSSPPLPSSTSNQIRSSPKSLSPYGVTRSP